MATQSFTVIPSGNWPNEVYSVNPDFNIINSDIQPIIGQNKFKYLNLPLTEVDLSVSEPTYSYIRSYYNEDPFALKQYYLNDTSLFSWQVSSLRSLNSGSIFNYFYLDLPEKNSDLYIRNSYLLYPYRLFLRPISAEKINDNDYRLVTSAVLISASVFYFNSEFAEEDAYNYHYQYINSNPNYINLPTNNNLSLIYNISSVEIVGEKNLIYYRPPVDGQSYYNPQTLSLTIGKPKSNVKVDRICLSYNIQYPPDVYSQLEGSSGPITLSKGIIINLLQYYCNCYTICYTVLTLSAV
jgi:hypothetical protein